VFLYEIEYLIGAPVLVTPVRAVALLAFQNQQQKTLYYSKNVDRPCPAGSVFIYCKTYRAKDFLMS